jgi:uncharacterized integral membrane protein
MRYFMWALRLVVFFVILMFALKNTDPVAINFYGAYILHDVPLIVVMLTTFVIGVMFGLLLILPRMMYRRREAMRLRRELVHLQTCVRQQPLHPEVFRDETGVPVAAGPTIPMSSF